MTPKSLTREELPQELRRDAAQRGAATRAAKDEARSAVAMQDRERRERARAIERRAFMSMIAAHASQGPNRDFSVVKAAKVAINSLEAEFKLPKASKF